MIEMLTVAETAKRAGVSEFAIRKWIAEDKLKAVKTGRKFLLNWVNVERFLMGGAMEV